MLLTTNMLQKLNWFFLKKYIRKTYDSFFFQPLIFSDHIILNLLDMKFNLTATIFIPLKNLAKTQIYVSKNFVFP